MIKIWWKGLSVKKQRYWFSGALLLMAIVLGLLPFDRINVTTSESMKSRFYWLSKDLSNLKRGDTVLYMDTNIATGNRLARLTKVLACDEGDKLTVDRSKEYYCNGNYIGRAKDFALNGEHLECFLYAGTIPKGKMFVMGQHKDSYDSRYRGLINKSEILARATPITVF